MTDFSKLDRAQDFLFAVTGSISRRVTAAGAGAWNHGAGHRQERERALRILVRSAARTDREAERLVGSGVPAGVVRAHTRRNAVIRDRADSRGARTSVPLGRASR